MGVGGSTFLLGLALALLRELGEGAALDEFEKVYLHVENPFAIRTLAVVVGILLALRTNMALDRWMEGISEIQERLSKWSSAFIALSGFFSGKVCSGQEEEERVLLFRARAAHWFSLMSCIAMATL